MNEYQAIAFGLFIFFNVIGYIVVAKDISAEKSGKWRPGVSFIIFIGFLFGGIGELLAHILCNIGRFANEPKKSKKKKGDIDEEPKLADEDTLSEQEKLELKYGGIYEQKIKKKFRNLRITFIALAIWSFLSLFLVLINTVGL